MQKGKKLSLGPKMPYLGIFRLEFAKAMNLQKTIVIHKIINFEFVSLSIYQFLSFMLN